MNHSLRNVNKCNVVLFSHAVLYIKELWHSNSFVFLSILKCRFVCLLIHISSLMNTIRVELSSVSERRRHR
ncbi:hypothetical protein X975_13971, partial [Stegodyphus mimosarum]